MDVGDGKRKAGQMSMKQILPGQDTSDNKCVNNIHLGGSNWFLRHGRGHSWVSHVAPILATGEDTEGHSCPLEK